MKIKHNTSQEAQPSTKAPAKDAQASKASKKKSFEEALAAKEKPKQGAQPDAERLGKAPLGEAPLGKRALGERATEDTSKLLGRLGERAQQSDAQAATQKQTRDASSELFRGTRDERSFDKRSEQKLDEVQLDTSLIQQDVRADNQQSVTQTEQAQGTDRADMQALVDKIVKACHVGKGERNKRVLLMTVEVPGQGEVHVKIERQRQGTSIRFRARDPALAQRLRAHAPRLQESLRAKGVGVTKLTVTAQNS